MTKKQKSDKEKKAELSAALQRRIVALSGMKERPVNLSEFALTYGIPYTSLSIWINKQRLPAPENQMMLARLFPEIGEIFDIHIVPDAMAEDQEFVALMAKWQQLTEAQRQAIRAVLDQYQGEGNHKHQHATAGGAA